MLLFAAGTDAEVYEEELRKTGLPTYRATGRGYFGQQQVVDLLSYLRLLHNRYDDKALLTVLASPFVGISNDGARARAARRRRSGRSSPASSTRCRRRSTSVTRGSCARSGSASTGSRDAMTRLSLERLCERIVGEHDYDLAVLAQWDGRRRYANMRKLARLARSYEELRGPDVEGFVRFVGEQEAVGARELEAVAEEEGADAVRLLTIHAAKGLEFKVVIVADAGRDKAPPSPDEILALSDGRFGFRVADPVTTKRRGAFDYDDVREARRLEEEAEKLRLYYVAMTRAKERLIVSGSIDREKTADASTPIGWVLGRLDADEELTAAGDGARRDRAERRAARRARRPLRRGRLGRGGRGRAEPEPRGRAARALRRARGGGRRAPPRPVLPPLVAPAEPPLHRLRRLSFTALSTFDQCSYKYYALYVVGHEGAPARASRRRRRRPARDGDRRRRPPAARAGRPARAGDARPRAGARLVPDRHATRSSSASAPTSRRTATRSSRAASPPARGSTRNGTSRSSTTASSCTVSSTCSTSTARARSSSTTRRT